MQAGHQDHRHRGNRLRLEVAPGRVGQPLVTGGDQIDPARRWAVVLDTGDLVFADTDELVPE
jgi:hypothetical protein